MNTWQARRPTPTHRTTRTVWIVVLAWLLQMACGGAGALAGHTAGTALPLASQAHHETPVASAPSGTSSAPLDAPCHEWTGASADSGWDSADAAAKRPCPDKSAAGHHQHGDAHHCCPSGLGEGVLPLLGALPQAHPHSNHGPWESLKLPPQLRPPHPGIL